MAVSDFVTLLRPNYATLSSTTLTEDSQASTDLAVENVLSTILSKRWRADGNSISNTAFGVNFLVTGMVSQKIARQVGGAAIVGHNLSTSALWRLRLSTSGSLSTGIETKPPDGIQASSGFTNDDGSTPFDATGLGQIDEDCDSPNSTYAKATGSGDYIRLTFGAISGTLVSGSSVQEFRIKARRENGDASDTLRVQLRESGNLIRALGDIVFTEASTLQEVTFLWDAVELGFASGVAVEIGIETNAAQTFWVDCVEWNAKVTTASDDYDSGFLNVFDTEAVNIFDDEGFTRHSAMELCAAHVMATQSTYTNARIEIYDPSPLIEDAAVDKIKAGDPTEVGYLQLGPKYAPLVGAKVVDIKPNQFGKRVFTVAYQTLERVDALSDIYAWTSMSSGVAQQVIRTESGGTFVRGQGGPVGVLIVQPNETDKQTIQNALVRLSANAEIRTLDKGRANVPTQFEEW